MRITFNYRDLKISEDDCLQILDENNQSTEEFDMDYSLRQNNRIMAVGYTNNAKLCEVGVEFFEKKNTVEHVHVFHGMKATKTYQDKYKERRK